MNGDHLAGRLKLTLRQWLEDSASLVNHKAVIKDVYLAVDISAGYFLMLTIANLIALLGLITNSVAIIIGAMLISPLMGPILSSGFAFITGDTTIGRKALKKVAYSVGLTILISALFTYLTPLQEVTGEITARTKPNLYDLIIAVLAGAAGAIAICTRKNYITTVTGVAIATAVIPPLSVAGFGIGVWNPSIAFGGFFLFFTNFVAIILATCIVFYTYGFKPGITTEIEKARLKRRIYAFATILFVISIPLLYTLKISIMDVRLRNNVSSALKLNFNREKASRLDSFAVLKGKDQVLEINAEVNTVRYLKESDIKWIEKNLAEYLRQDIRLNVEQVLVRSGGLKEESGKPAIAPVIPPKAREGIPRSSVETVLTTIKSASEKVERIIEPSKVSGFHIGIDDDTSAVSVIMKIKRDKSLSDEQTKWLKQILSDELKISLDLKIETVPLKENTTELVKKKKKQKRIK
ncbi:MAG: TIGR00341 family protein [Nitrospirae bacterium]|nr:MAG: TIGR00341 family protein [Nitrospirota bacterium]